jgi:hypothetical protein
LPAWNFSDEVLRWLLHGKQSAPSSENLLIPFIGIDPPKVERTSRAARPLAARS